MRRAGVGAGEGGGVFGRTFAIAFYAGVAEARDLCLVVRVRVGSCAAGAGATLGGGFAGGAGGCLEWRSWEPAGPAAVGPVPRDGGEAVFSRGVVGVVLYCVLIVVLCVGVYYLCRVPSCGEVFVRLGLAPYGDSVSSSEFAREGGRGGG